MVASGFNQSVNACSAVLRFHQLKRKAGVPADECRRLANNSDLSAFYDCHEHKKFDQRASKPS